MIVIYGVARYGKVDAADGEYLATRFIHIFGLPLVPIESEWITGRDQFGTYGRACRLSLRSIAAAYARTWGLVLGLAFAALASAGVTEFVFPAMSLAVLVTASFAMHRVTDPRQLRRVALQRPVLGIALDPIRLFPDDAASLLATARERLDSQTSRGNAFLLLRLVAASRNGCDADEAFAASERWLDEPTLQAGFDDGPYRTALFGAPAVQAPLVESHLLPAHRWHGVIATLVSCLVTAFLVGPSHGRHCCGGSKWDIARSGVSRLAFEAYPQWQARHPDRRCPTLGELAEFGSVVKDPFGTPYAIRCESLPAGAVGIAVWSWGENQTDESGGGDDISSWPP